MNCAKITVTGDGKGFDGPDVFVANLASVNSVKTVLGTDVIYPDPGPSVEYGGDGKRAPPTGVEDSGKSTGAESPDVSSDSSPTAAAPVVGEASTPPTAAVPVASVPDVASNATVETASPTFQGTSTKYVTVTAIGAVDVGTADPSEATAIVASPNLPVATAVPAGISATGSEPALATVADPAPTAEPVSPTAAPPAAGTALPAVPATGAAASGSCTDGDLVCSSDGTQFAMCNGGAPTAFQAVAPGTACRNGAIGFARMFRKRSWF
jgi:hypothetical protein